ncbi:MAG: hypothetical protein ACOC9Y_10290 [Chloroflexota bacterium]
MKRIQEKKWLLIVGYDDGNRDYLTFETRDEADRRRRELTSRSAGSSLSPAVTVITPIERDRLDSVHTGYGQLTAQ